MDFGERYAIPPYIYSATFDDGRMTTMNCRSDKIDALNHTMATLIRGVGKSGSIGYAIDNLQKTYPDIGQNAIRQDAEVGLSKARESGLIVPSKKLPLVELPPHEPMVHGGAEAKMAILEEDFPPFLQRARVMGYIAIIAMLKTLPTSSLMTAIERRQTRLPEATYEEALAVVDSIARTRASRWLKAKCLEKALAASIHLTVRGRSSELCLAVADAPLRYHAYLRVEGRPVIAKDEDKVEGQYTRLWPPISIT